MASNKYYAVSKGQGCVNTIYKNWKQCQVIARGPGAKFKGFEEYEEAKDYLVYHAKGKSIKVTHAWDGETTIIRGTKRIMGSSSAIHTPKPTKSKQTPVEVLAIPNVTPAIEETVIEIVPVLVAKPVVEAVPIPNDDLSIIETENTSLRNQELIPDFPPDMIIETIIEEEVAAPEPKKPRSKVYAVKLGLNVRDKLYYSWPECNAVTKGCPSKFKSFFSEEEALEWMALQNYTPYGFSNNNDVLSELDYDSRAEFESKCFMMDMSMATIVKALIEEWLIETSETED